MIAMLITGFTLLILFVAYELRLAKRPVIAPRFWKNRAIVGASVIGFFDFVRLFLLLIPPSVLPVLKFLPFTFNRVVGTQRDVY